MTVRTPAPAWVEWRRTFSSYALKWGFEGLSRAGRVLPHSRRLRDGVEVVRDLEYRPGGEDCWKLDVYRPAGARGPLPVLVYVHGGGFRILSKDTHWMYGCGFARMGWLVLNLNYRLAPRHPFPAAVEDAAAGLVWAVEHARELGGDPSRLVYAGESAGANLATTLAIASCWKRPEPAARAVWDSGARPIAVIASCGMLQASDADRYLRRDDIPAVMRDRVAVVCREYLPDDSGDPERFALADPVRLLEGARAPDRPLPRFFASVGTSDPVQDDTRRLVAALRRLGAPVVDPVYEGGVHAFEAFVGHPLSRRWWEDVGRFLSELPDPS